MYSHDDGLFFVIITYSIYFIEKQLLRKDK